MKYIIGCYGFGFLGSAIAHAFGNDNEIKYFALNEKNCELPELAKSDFIFIALPSPMNIKTGVCDLSIIDSSLGKLDDLKCKSIIIIKSTVPPGSTEKFAKKYKKLKIVFSPEFLTARSAKLDFINSARIVLGGPKKYVDRAEELHRSRFIHTPILKTDYKTAEFIKYMANIFFATKVIYMNTAYQACKKFGINWDQALKGFLLDMRIGNSHYQVPGHDGGFGFSGTCFPKDINAYIWWLKENGLKDEAKLFETVWSLNLKYRPERDWEGMESVVSK